MDVVDNFLLGKILESLNVMASFSALGGDFQSIPLIVLHGLVGSDLWLILSMFVHSLFWCSFICCRACEVGSLDLRSSHGHIFPIHLLGRALH